jgi:hypothetical protein
MVGFERRGEAMERGWRARLGIAWALAGAFAVGWLWLEPRELDFDEARALGASWRGALYEVDPGDSERHLELVDRCYHGHDARACATHFHRVRREAPESPFPDLDTRDLPRIGWRLAE